MTASDPVFCEIFNVESQIMCSFAAITENVRVNRCILDVWSDLGCWWSFSGDQRLLLQLSLILSVLTVKYQISCHWLVYKEAKCLFLSQQLGWKPTPWSFWFIKVAREKQFLKLPALVFNMKELAFPNVCLYFGCSKLEIKRGYGWIVPVKTLLNLLGHGYRTVQCIIRFLLQSTKGQPATYTVMKKTIFLVLSAHPSA